MTVATLRDLPTAEQLRNVRSALGIALDALQDLRLMLEELEQLGEPAAQEIGDAEIGRLARFVYDAQIDCRAISEAVPALDKLVRAIHMNRTDVELRQAVRDDA